MCEIEMVFTQRGFGHVVRNWCVKINFFRIYCIRNVCACVRNIACIAPLFPRKSAFGYHTCFSVVSDLHTISLCRPFEEKVIHMDHFVRLFVFPSTRHENPTLDIILPLFNISSIELACMGKNGSIGFYCSYCWGTILKDPRLIPNA